LPLAHYRVSNNKLFPFMLLHIYQIRSKPFSNIFQQISHNFMYNTRKWRWLGKFKPNQTTGTTCSSIHAIMCYKLLSKLIFTFYFCHIFYPCMQQNKIMLATKLVLNGSFMPSNFPSSYKWHSLYFKTCDRMINICVNVK